MDRSDADTSRAGRGVLAALVVLLVVAPFAGLTEPPWWLAIAGATAALSGVAWRFHRWPVTHLGLVATAVLALGGSGFLGPWPVPVVVAFALYAGLVWFVPALRSSIDWVIWQRRPADAGTRALFIATVVVSVGALVAYAWIATPDVADFAAGLGDVPVWTLPLIGVGFAAVNPAVEEAIYRGVLFRALEAESGSVVLTIVSQAVAFGALHAAGFPGGPVGMVMAGVWGGVLGVFRARTGGLRLSYWAHVATNVVIFVAVLVLASDQGLL